MSVDPNKELDFNLVTILNEHRHEQIDSKQAMKELKQAFGLFLKNRGISGEHQLISQLEAGE